MEYSSSSDDEIPDISTLKPYDWEPCFEEGETELSCDVNVDREQKNARCGNIDWCSCKKCRIMASENESLCCYDNNEVPEEFFQGMKIV